MQKHPHQMTSVSALLGVPVADAAGRTVGHVRELAVSPTVDAKYVQGFLLRMPGAEQAGEAFAGRGRATWSPSPGGLQMRGDGSAGAGDGRRLVPADGPRRAGSADHRRAWAQGGAGQRCGAGVGARLTEADRELSGAGVHGWRCGSPRSRWGCAARCAGC